MRGSSTSSKPRASPPRARGPGPLVVGFSVEAELGHVLADTDASFLPRLVHFPDRLPAQQAASATATATPLGAAAASLYQLFVDGGAGGLDFSGIYRLIGKSDDKI